MPSNPPEKQSQTGGRGIVSGDKKSTTKNDKSSTKEEMSDEDLALKEGLELAVSRLKEDDSSLYKQAIDYLVGEIKSATASMTSVPKPLKFLRPHYDTLKKVYESWPLPHPLKRAMADVLSVLAMTMASPGTRESLKFKLLGTSVNISSWGHEYVRSLAGEISEEFNQRLLDAPAEEEAYMDDLLLLVDDILPFQMKHNAEAEAVDLLLEVKQLNKLVDCPVVDERNYERVCLYLIRIASFVADPDDLVTLYNTAFAIYTTQRKYTDALRVALKIDDMTLVAKLMADDSAASSIEKYQMAYILAKHRSNFCPTDEKLNEIIGNLHLSDQFLSIATEMDVRAPKSPEDIYKTHLNEGILSSRSSRNSGTVVDSAKANLAATFVNAFVNAGYCKDKLLVDEDNGWLFKNKNHGIISAAASMGLLMLWNVDEGLNKIDKYFHNTDEFVLAGACLGAGILQNGIRSESDPALALLTDQITSNSENVRICSVCGLGIAYAGAQREELKDLLEPIVSNSNSSIALASMAALSLGLIYVGTCNEDISSTLLTRLMESSDVDLNLSISRYLCLGLGLLYLGKGEKADAAMETLRTIEHKRGKYATLTIETCAAAGTGNVLKVQQMLRICTDHITEAAEHQAVAVLGIALVTIGEEIGTEMTLGTFEHLLHYGELPVRRVVPLALALLYISNPEYAIIDYFSRLSHDQDAEIAQSAILGLGLISAGSNNSRVAGILRQLAEFYSREANHLYTVRIAQGLNAMGKGLLSLNPFHSDRLLLNGPALAGLLVVLHGFIDMKGLFFDKYSYLLYYLTCAMNPRYLATLDTSLQPTKVSVRVGLAVETVGQAGRPKTITGFQTHTTPVLLGYKDRAEIAGSDLASVSSVVEGVVIVETISEKQNNGETKQNP